MDEYSSILNELVKAKENIKRKFSILKNGEANVQSLVTHTLKPIIDPLTEITKKKNLDTNNSNIEKNVVYKEPSIKKDFILENSFFENKKNLDTNNLNTEKDFILENSFSDEQKQSNKSRFNHWFQSPNKDKLYGPSNISNDGYIILGNKEINFNEENILSFEDNSYLLTPGLEQLIFSKNPKLYTPQDLITYKQILVQTSVHLTADGNRIKQGGTKYKNIIQKLFPPTGAGLKYGGLKLQKHNLVYWNDPNELVDRLRLLLASQTAGNNSVSNEILSIFEELYEAGLIKRIPNV